MAKDKIKTGDHIGLNQLLMDQVNGLNEGSVNTQRAKEISNTVGKMIGLTKVAIEAGKVQGLVPKLPLVNMAGAKKIVK